MCAALVLQGASDYKKPDKNLNRIENEGHLRSRHLMSTDTYSCISLRR